MKHIFFGLVVLLAGAQANAMSMRRYLNAELTEFQFRENSQLQQRNITSGNVSIDFALQEVTLSLYPTFHCPAPRICALVMPAPVIIKVPLRRTERGNCGEIIYTANEPTMPANGMLQTITVTNNMTNTCEMVFNLAPTEVKLVIQGAGHPHFYEQHSMLGDQLN